MPTLFRLSPALFELPTKVMHADPLGRFKSFSAAE